jgi:hypothetical protein
VHGYVFSDHVVARRAFTPSLLQFLVHLVCEDVGAHYAYVLMDELIHFDCVGVVVERAEKTR